MAMLMRSTTGVGKLFIQARDVVKPADHQNHHQEVCCNRIEMNQLQGPVCQPLVGLTVATSMAAPAANRSALFGNDLQACADATHPDPVLFAPEQLYG